MNGAAEPRQFLCPAADIEDGESSGAVATILGRDRPLILVRQGDRVFGYVNSCPHIGAPLDFRPGSFLTLDKSMIQCANHGAQFRIDDGYCVSGPCGGASLAAVDVVVAGGNVYLQTE